MSKGEAKSRIHLFVERDGVLAPTRTAFRLERDGRVLCVIDNGKPEAVAQSLETAITSDLAFENGFTTYTIYGIGADQSVLSSVAIKGRGTAGQDVASSNTGAQVNAELVRLAKQSSDQLLENNRQLFQMMLELHRQDQAAIAQKDALIAQHMSELRQAEVALAQGRDGDETAKAVFYDKMGDMAKEAVGLLPLLLMKGQRQETSPAQESTSAATEEEDK